MPKSITVTLNKQAAEFIQSQLTAGHYTSASEVVRAGLAEGEAGGISPRNVLDIWAAVQARP